MSLLFLGYEILKYWDILIEYINPLVIFLWAIVGGLVGLLLAIILLLFSRKQILVKRCHWTLKWLSYTYLAVIPLLISFSFAQWFALHNCERQIINNIPKYLGDTNILYNIYLKAEVEKIVSEEILKSSSNELLESAVGSAQTFIGSALKSESTKEIQAATYKDKVSAYVVQTFLESTYVRNLIVSEVRKQAGKVLLMDEKLSEDFFDMKVQELLDSGIINTILEKHVRHLMGGFKTNVLLLLLLGLAIPLTEIIIANYIYRKKRIDSTNISQIQ